MPQQFVNPANPEAHYRKTAVELCEQLGKKIDIYVSGVGSGGTLQGIAKYLLEQNPDTKIVAVEPKGVSALHGDGPGIHQIQGIGDGFIPDVLDTGLITDVVEVSDEDAINTARKLAKEQGLLAVSYTHLDVYKRQYKHCRLYSEYHFRLCVCGGYGAWCAGKCNWYFDCSDCFGTHSVWIFYEEEYPNQISQFCI